MSRKPPFDPTDDHKHTILEHVRYEIEMIVNCARESMPEEPHSPVVRRAVRESLLLHARSMIDFFEKPASKRFKLDVLSEDFAFPAAPFAYDVAFRNRLHRDLAHLTYGRLERAGPRGDWRVVDFVPLLRRCGAFAAHLLAHGLAGNPDQWDAIRYRADGLVRELSSSGTGQPFTFDTR